MEDLIQKLIEKNSSRLTYISAQHPLVRQIIDIRKNSCCSDGCSYLVEGIGVHLKLITTKLKIQKLLFCPEMIRSKEAYNLLESCMERAAETFIMSMKLNKRLSDRDEPDGFLSLAGIPCFDIDSARLSASSTIVVLDGLENPGNIGTILRTCDGAGVAAVFICSRKVRMTSPNLVKSTMGAIFNIPVFEFEKTENCIRWLEKNHFAIYLADTRAERNYNNTNFSGNTALVMGSERYGISEEWYAFDHQKIAIPMFGICDSLNVGAAASIIIYEACLKKDAFKITC